MHAIEARRLVRKFGDYGRAARSGPPLDWHHLSGRQPRRSADRSREPAVPCGLLHHPKVLFLDEPTIGLDPQTRRHIWQYLMKLRKQEGVTMFMTTHYMEEAEHCDRIAVRWLACGQAAGDKDHDTTFNAEAAEHAEKSFSLRSLR